MEPVIAVLAGDVIDQIAAGEVIERPASVVKELVDNAIDAGARTISVETVAGGRALIRVSDDGCGMSAASARLALERHATSKIRCVDDLWALTSMGFRGEALPSIASVSRMTLTTRREGDLAATRIVIEASRVLEVTEIGAPVGTTIEVTDLLFNLPARLKFLKGESTEASHITDLLGKVAMAHPRLHVRLRHNGRTSLETPPDRDGFARAQALLGPRIAARLVAVSGEEAGVRVTAYLGAPELAQATARGVQLFVGLRPIRDRGLLHAIAMGYGELVPRGRYPIAIVHVDVPAGAVDVNVHPQKLEVRFSEATEVAAAVRHIVQAGVAAAPWRAELGGAGPIQMSAMTSVAPPRLAFDGPGATALSARYAAQLRERSQVTLSFAGGETGSAGSAESRAWAAQLQSQVRASRAAETHEARESARREDAAWSTPRAGDPLQASHGPRDASSELAEGSGPVPSTGFFSSLRFLGQLDLTYLVCEGGGELVLVDQHSAHERVELERLRARSTDRDVTIQKLLFPMTIEVTAAEVELVGRVAQLLAHVGFEVEAFGKTTLAVKAVPAGIRHGDPAQLLTKLLAEWAADGAPSEEERLDTMLAQIACHSVVRAGDRLSPSEAEALLRGLDGVAHADRGPHGRPILLRLPLAEIARRFGR
ncbi:MAG: DNA mismatch repair endonuclease MutL [Deltaproteobacteria bacterium]|nr:DNA mismatch repair endonuclease MutL [Deltaproteobacteria bacterium]